MKRLSILLGSIVVIIMFCGISVASVPRYPDASTETSMEEAKKIIKEVERLIDVGYYNVRAHRFEAAIKKFRESIAIHPTPSACAGIGNALVGWGIVLKSEEDSRKKYREAIKEYETALVLVMKRYRYLRDETDRSNLRDMESRILNNIGETYGHLEEYYIALNYLKRALEMRGFIKSLEEETTPQAGEYLKRR
jgi:tetratricopeptide (TPR) repeat protein